VATGCAADYGRRVLHGPPPRWTPASFRAAIARLRLDRLRIGNPSPALLCAYAKPQGFDVLVDLLVGYRRLIVGRAADDIAADAEEEADRARAMLARVEPLLSESWLPWPLAATVPLVVRETVELIASCLAVGVEPPPLAWAAFMALQNCAPLSGAYLDSDLSAFEALREGFMVDADRMYEHGVEGLTGATIVHARSGPDDDGQTRLRLVTRRRGTWVFGLRNDRLSASLWDFPCGLPAPTASTTVHEATGRLTYHTCLDDPDLEGALFEIDGARVLRVTRPRYGDGPTVVDWAEETTISRERDEW
jgi:hypothetical protein